MRLQAVQAQLASFNLDGLIITDKLNWRYLSGFTGSNGLLVVTPTTATLLIDGRYAEQAAQQTNHVTLRVAPVGESIYSLLKEFASLKRIGFESQTIAYQAVKLLQESLAQTNVTLVPTKNVVELQRMIKTPEESTAIRKAAAISDQTLHEVLPMIQAGMTELELANEIDYRSKRLGSEGPAFETIVAAGKRTALPHAHASHAVIEKDQLIMIDFGSIYHGYYSDITRTFGFGTVGTEIEQAYQILLQAQINALATIKGGTSFGLVDEAARHFLAEHDLAGYFSHNLGHGIGLSCHEYPNIAPKQSVKVQANMVFTVEPGIYLPKKFGIRIEDDVLLTKSGTVECLTKFPKEWMVIE